MLHKIIFPLIQLAIPWMLISCASYEKFQRMHRELEIPSEIFKSDFNQTWQAVIQVMKNYEIKDQNQEAGVIKTRWMDNTLEYNFSHSFEKRDAIKAAKFKLVINVVKGYRFNQEVSKVTIYRRQLIEQDFLQGMKETPSDGIDEKIVLYRIKRLIEIDNELKRIDKAKEQEQLKNF